MHQITASWSIYVTLDPPPFPVELALKVDQLNNTFRNVIQSSKHLLVDLSSYSVRQRRLETILAGQRQQRSKRGLIDLGGSILNTLFGVATTAQLKRFQTALTEIGSQQDAMLHAHNSLVTVINQTRINVQQLSANEVQLAAHLHKVNAAVIDLSHSVNAHAQHIRRLELLTNLDRYMGILELTAEAYKDQLSMFHRQRTELEAGRLTRDLLQPSQLMDILKHATSGHSAVTDITWFYKFLTVSPITQPHGALIYILELPLISPRPYLMYHLHTHPVPISNTSFTIKVNLETIYSLDTVTGDLVIPQGCQGSNPTLCFSNPQFGPSMLKCARGVLTQRKDLINHCSVDIMPHPGHTILTPMSINHYAAANLIPQTITIRCPGQSEQHRILKQGTFNISCNQACTISGSGWTISCISTLHIDMRYSLPLVRVTEDFRFNSVISSESLAISLPQLQLPNPTPALNIPLTTLLNPKATQSHLMSTTTSNVITFFNLLAIAIVIITLGLLIVRARLILLKFRHSMNTQKEQIELDEINPEQLKLTDNQHEKSQPKPQRISLWPSLPRFDSCLQDTAAPLDPTLQDP